MVGSLDSVWGFCGKFSAPDCRCDHAVAAPMSTCLSLNKGGGVRRVIMGLHIDPLKQQQQVSSPSMIEIQKPH
jgi:hypothetical protein